MNHTISNIYKTHHKDKHREGFSVMEKGRSLLLKEVIGKGKKVLDLGCRDGTLTKYFAEGNMVTGVDIDDNNLAKAKSLLSIETILFDLNNDWQELSGRLFDIIVAGEVLEHIYFPNRVVKLVSEHLASGGIFVGSVPNAFSLKNRMRYLIGQKKNTPLEDSTHINHFSVKELDSILKKFFSKVNIIGLGRFKRLAKIFPNLAAFDIFFICKK